MFAKTSGIFALLFASFCFAQIDAPQPGTGPVQLTIRVGSGPSNVYNKLYDQWAQVCTTPTSRSVNSQGSIVSLDAVLNNEANLAFVQSDVLVGRKEIENDQKVDSIRIFAPLYYSELHILAARSNSSISDLFDLTNKKIGAYGGAYITARIVLGRGGIHPYGDYQGIQQFTSEKEGIAALVAGKIDAFFVVAGQPADSMKEVNPASVKLVTINGADKVAASSKGMYVKANLRYPAISAVTVPTIGVQIYLITFNYQSQQKKVILSQFKQCLAKNILDLRETTGNHPKWVEINPEAKTTAWPMFETVAATKK